MLENHLSLSRGTERTFLDQHGTRLAFDEARWDALPVGTLPVFLVDRVAMGQGMQNLPTVAENMSEFDYYKTICSHMPSRYRDLYAVPVEKLKSVVSRPLKAA